jgi:hypothetical protein
LSIVIDHMPTLPFAQMVACGVISWKIIVDLVDGSFGAIVGCIASMK